jgi:hypothetical protein
MVREKRVELSRVTPPDPKAGYLEQIRERPKMLMSEEFQAQRVKRGIWTPTTIKKKIPKNENLTHL